MFVFGSKPVISKTQVASGDPVVTLSPCDDSMVKGLNILETAYASSAVSQPGGTCDKYIIQEQSDPKADK